MTTPNVHPFLFLTVVLPNMQAAFVKKQTNREPTKKKRKQFHHTIRTAPAKNTHDSKLLIHKSECPRTTSFWELRLTERNDS